LKQRNPKSRLGAKKIDRQMKQMQQQLEDARVNEMDMDIGKFGGAPANHSWPIKLSFDQESLMRTSGRCSRLTQGISRLSQKPAQDKR